MSIRHRLREHARDWPGYVAGYRLDGTELTFSDVDGLAEPLRALLPSRLQRVLVRGPNTLETLALLYALWEQDVSTALVSSVLPDEELDRRAEELGVDAVVDAVGELKVHPSGGARDVEDDEMVIIFTSGSTGRPKGAILTTAAIETSLGHVAAGSRVPIEGRPPEAPARGPYLVMSMLAHIQGLLGALASWHLGQPLLMLPKFDAERVVALAQRFDIRTLRLAPPMLYDILRTDASDLGGVRAVTCGSAALAEPLRLQFEDRFGIPVLATYGQTEFAGGIAFERIDDVRAGRRANGSVGRVAPGVDVQIRDDHGREVPIGAEGRIWARSQSSMRRYAHDAGSADTDGFRDTGDLGHLDEAGFLFVHGRADDVIICGGFNVYPAMVEAELLARPDIADAVVVPAEDERLGAVPVAIVVATGDQHVDEEATIAALRETLSPYELPRRLHVIDELPRTAGGKVDRRAARSLVAR